MIIKTPAELMSARTALGLTREDLSQITGFTATEIKTFEHVRSLAVPIMLIDVLHQLQMRQEELIAQLISAIAIVTFWSVSDFENHALEVDRLAPSLGFHQTAAAIAHEESPEGCVLVCFHPQLFAESKHGGEDSLDTRRLWARDWARQYRVEDIRPTRARVETPAERRARQERERSDRPASASLGRAAAGVR